MLDIANPGTPLPKGKTIGSRDQPSDARLLQETVEENGKEVSAQPANLHPAQPDDIAIRDLVAKTYAVVLATVKNLVVAAAEKDPQGQVRTAEIRSKCSRKQVRAFVASLKFVIEVEEREHRLSARGDAVDARKCTGSAAAKYEAVCWSFNQRSQILRCGWRMVGISSANRVVPVWIGGYDQKAGVRFHETGPRSSRSGRRPRWLPGPPTWLAAYEDRKLYRGLVDAIVHEYRPKEVIEWIWVNEIVNSQFMAMQFAKWQEAMLQFSLPQGVRRAVKNRLRHGTENEDDLEWLAEKKESEIRPMIPQAAIQSETFLSRRIEMDSIHRREVSAQRRRDLSLRQLDQRRSRKQKEAAQISRALMAEPKNGLVPGIIGPRNVV